MVKQITERPKDAEKMLTIFVILNTVFVNTYNKLFIK